MKNIYGIYFICCINNYLEVVKEQLDILNNGLREKISKNLIPIYFLGTLNEDQMYDHYQKSEYVIHPSSTESFGLVLIESCLMRCKLIAPQTEYVNEVVIPSLQFNDITFNSIYNTLLFATMYKTNEPKILIENKLSLLLELIH